MPDTTLQRETRDISYTEVSYTLTVDQVRQALMTYLEDCGGYYTKDSKVQWLQDGSVVISTVYPK